MRKILTLLLVLFAFGLSAQQARQVYITLDVSGSMLGNKYSLANYTTQMIVALCDKDDDVHMIVYGEDKLLSKEKKPLSVIQRPMSALNFGRPRSSMSQFDDILGFNDVYRPSSSRQNWLFIIGDGYWSTDLDDFAEGRKHFQNIVKSGSLNVCYLQTCEKLEEHSDFTRFVEELGLVDIEKSSIDPETIRRGCNHFAKKILGFSATSLNINKESSNVLSVEADLPIEEFLLVYQDEVKPSGLPSIEKAHYDEKNLSVTLKGTPTTLPVKTNNSDKDLSGNVWRLKANGSIPAHTPIIIEFDKAIDKNKVSVYPLLRNINFGTFGLAPAGGPLIAVNDRTFTICQDEKTALVRIELDDASKGSLPEELVKKMRVVVKANNKEYKASYKDEGFECKIDLETDTTQYYAECDCPGYFSRVTPIMTILKGECEPVKPEINERPTVDFGTMSFRQLSEGPITGVIQDSETLEELDPANFDISIEVENPYLYDEPKIRIENGKVLIDVHPRGEWCECLFPTDLNIKVSSTPKQGAIGEGGKHYVKTVTPIHLNIVKDRPWLTRCFWVLVAQVLLLFLIIYLRALMRKNRFKKNAMITPRYYSYYGDLIDDQGGCKLRREGFGPWLQRWLLPGNERTTLSFDKPVVSGLTLIATESEEVVNIPKSCCNWETMTIDNYDPESDTSKKKTVTLGNNGMVEITDFNGKPDGMLVFTSGPESDGATYRLFLGLLMVAALLAMVVLIVLMIRSL